jgi:hypothetical protein
MDKIFLIGNGINNVKSDYRWEDLINNVINFIGATGIISTINKPFPLLYEEIFVEAIKNRGFNEVDIKEFIANEILKLEPNNVHKAILNSGARNILTTNYDFTFEKLMTNKLSDLNNDGIVKETTYNIFRHHSFHDYIFWHIHGDANNPLAITLGYEHYSGYLQQMRNYIVTGTGGAYKIKFDSVIKRIKGNNPFKINSWLDFFFNDNIFIIGLTLDFIEIHLWWLLTFRQRAILTSELPLTNKIYYFFPSSFANTITSKLELLKNVGVTTYSVADNINKETYYLEVLKIIRKL